MMEVGDLIDGADAIFLDFDGPVCNLFAGYPASLVADDLRAFLAAGGIPATDGIAAQSDPLEILRWVAMRYPAMTTKVDDALRTAERTAVRSASPTAYSRDVIVAAHAAGRAVAIVSNNAEPAIVDYLALHDLSPHVAFVAGRAHGEPQLMKPHPDSVERAVTYLDVPANACAFVGDSVTDVEVSQVTGVRSVGYAKTPARRPDLVNAGADVVIDSMRELVMALDA